MCFTTISWHRFVLVTLPLRFYFLLVRTSIITHYKWRQCLSSHGNLQDSPPPTPPSNPRLPKDIFWWAKVFTFMNSKLFTFSFMFTDLCVLPCPFPTLLAYLSSCFSTICWKDFTFHVELPRSLCKKNQLTFCVWIYFWLLYFVWLIYLSILCPINTALCPVALE